MYGIQLRSTAREKNSRQRRRAQGLHLDLHMHTASCGVCAKEHGKCGVGCAQIQCQPGRAHTGSTYGMQQQMY